MAGFSGTLARRCTTTKVSPACEQSLSRCCALVFSLVLTREQTLLHTHNLFRRHSLTLGHSHSLAHSNTLSLALALRRPVCIVCLSFSFSHPPLLTHNLSPLSITATTLLVLTHLVGRVRRLEHAHLAIRRRKGICRKRERERKTPVSARCVQERRAHGRERFRTHKQRLRTKAHSSLHLKSCADPDAAWIFSEPLRRHDTIIPAQSTGRER